MPSAPDPVHLSLNTATTRAQWGLAQAIDGCARHGIRGIAPWRDQLAAMTFGYSPVMIELRVWVVPTPFVPIGLPIPASSPFRPGGTWSAEAGEEFFAARSGSPSAFVSSEIVRYLGWPGQAISYKLGERAWLAGRAAARARHEADGGTFDLRGWHTAALSLGSLGLDDLERELGAL